jgi:phosphoribosyl 1,2-cyclic phosphodiesterase
MQVRFWGVRGSVAVPNRNMLGYGGNTSCVEVTLADGTQIILDAGTGIREVAAARTPRASTVQILLTHLHLDHIQGLLFFSPFFDPTSEITVYGPAAPGPNLDQRLARYLSAPLSPVDLHELPARVQFAPCPHEEWEVGGARIRAAIVAHRGVTLGYRITEGDTTLCYLPDHEPALGVSLADADPGWISGIGLADGATALIHDAQYTDDEYAAHVGWGHSRVSDTVIFASRADVRQLILFHHDPDHDDAQLDEIQRAARRSWDHLGRDPATLSMAAEGTTLAL